jgi:hypothetical protein
LIMSVGFARLVITTNGKEAKMTTPKIGETFTTAKSGVEGTITEVVKNDNGSYRIKLDVAGQTRWTTAK